MWLISVSSSCLSPAHPASSFTHHSASLSCHSCVATPLPICWTLLCITILRFIQLGQDLRPNARRYARMLPHAHYPAWHCVFEKDGRHHVLYGLFLPLTRHAHATTRAHLPEPFCLHTLRAHPDSLRIHHASISPIAYGVLPTCTATDNHLLTRYPTTPFTQKAWAFVPLCVDFGSFDYVPNIPYLAERGCWWFLIVLHVIRCRFFGAGNSCPLIPLCFLLAHATWPPPTFPFFFSILPYPNAPSLILPTLDCASTP